MENWENKIIEKKLNSLQTLPEGYNPDMLSKWEIIEAGLPKQKNKKDLLFKWMAAATIIGVVFYSMCILYLASQKQQIVQQLPSNKISTSILIPINKQLVKAEKLQHPINLNAKKTMVINKTLIVKKDNNKALIKIEVPVLNNANSNTIINVPTNTETTLLATTQPEIIKPTKRKVFQKDFKDDVLTLGTLDKATTEHSIFKIQLNKKLLEEDGQSSPALQWKKSL